ncbi:GATA transcription factor (Ams2) [Metarhizium album ARSEF 1941]|uniref:GATA transcription factor (Ams2) n=1 Tax=Metarhizium album (strain ARSEF 1941) TaxID=1081103 RepID=A0A0B2X6T8_METAS|nr:GATA transcription factor (Ams2) [Metarhizium album ARSEF 1941]KHO01478.1 GATA transcription factor (Ams2) [Metarhizium album ARSEF 1941]
MASPAPIAPTGSAPWNRQNVQQQQHQYQQQRMPAQTPQAPQAEADENGVQTRAMGLKVHYTFDAEAKVNCLARYPQPLQVQTVPIDETNSIGVVDLRSCIHAVMDCSPELAGQENDYTIYAVDFSEPDFPLVGQGLLSWALEAMQSQSMMQQPKMVTGRVAKNLPGIFGGGHRETLEVRLRLSVAPRSNKPALHSGNGDMQQHTRPVESAMTPTGASEWNTFIQSNPQIGQISHVSRVVSPALSQGHGHPHQQPPVMSSRESFASVPAQQPQVPTHDVHRIAPIPVDLSEQLADGAAPSSRPSSRASNRAPRRKPPTGRPRGRPRKKPVEGNTSGYEDGTEGEDGPAKKRVKTTQVERTAPNLFANGPESLRVAASTSGSLRTFRPIVANTEGPSGSGSSHLQEVPRAPTPVPDRSLHAGPGRGPGPVKLRRESALNQQLFSNNASSAESRQPLSPGQEDGRSPESMAPTPSYSVDSPADIGSSPPVQRATPFLRSSLPPSSPVLPPMPPTELNRDASFATDDLDDLFGDEADAPAPMAPTKALARAVRKPTESRNASGVPIQVFQMQDGPAGQDLVHICSYNSPQPAPAAAVKEGGDMQSLPSLKKAPIRIAAKKKTKPPSPPGMAPTPPPTTDAVENAATPPLTAEQGTEEAGQRICNHVNIAPEPAAEQLHPQNTQQDMDKEGEPTQGPAAAKAPRQLGRSQSAGPLALPTIPAGEPAGPSSLSRCIVSAPKFPAPPAPSALKRAASTGPLALPVPASDPVVPIALPTSMETVTATFAKSDAVPAPSSPPLVASRANKNIVKKHAIKQRLEEAIMNGEMPPYCSNCGAIETPTWRKIWVQENDGVPEYCEYSEKPGKITAIEILQRDGDGKPTVHRLVKKSLGPSDDRAKWQERLLCNPCGIWLTKCKSHRPQDRWDKDLSRVGQERRKRGTGRSKKSRGKDDGANPTSEAYLPTDAFGPVEPSSPKQPHPDLPNGRSVRDVGVREESASLDMQESQSNPGSTHSGGSGTAKSPVDVEFDQAVGSTKRLLFPSPRKDGAPKSLEEINVNIVQTSDECLSKGSGTGKENTASTRPDEESNDDDDVQAVSKKPAAVARPSTPTPSSKAGTPKEPLKTPSRPTPSHRPITRSISRSIRTIRSIASPGQALVQGTPTRTSRLPESGLPRRSPRNHQGGFEVFDTPISRTISQMFSEGNGFGADDLDLSSLPALDDNAGSMLDFGNLLSTDAVMPSSPPKDGSMLFDYHASSSAWAQWDMDTS